jgi:hypothetical protein
MKRVGTVKRLQVHPTTLIGTQGSEQIYDPALLLIVPALHLTNQGVIGLVNGSEVVDIHHAAHPRSKYRESNAISFNFTSHYGRMQQRFGKHMTLGCAGENILIEADTVYDEAALANGLVVKTYENQLIHLSQINVASPCREFSNYATSHARNHHPAAKTIKEAMQFLNYGTRGFYCVYRQEEIAVVQVGDGVFMAA